MHQAIMPEIENIEEENSKEQIANSNKEVNENISHEQTIEATKLQTQNYKLEKWKYIIIQKLKRKISKNIF